MNDRRKEPKKVVQLLLTNSEYEKFEKYYNKKKLKIDRTYNRETRNESKTSFILRNIGITKEPF